jgi:hypothetical protein
MVTKIEILIALCHRRTAMPKPGNHVDVWPHADKKGGRLCESRPSPEVLSCYLDEPAFCARKSPSSWIAAFTFDKTSGGILSF